jgi:hypothetical protein
MILHLTNIVSENLKSDIILNKNLTNISPSNMYEILFDSENFDKILNIVLQKITETTNTEFDVYVKNMWGYIQNTEETKSIDFNINFKNQIIIPSNYSFIYIVESNTTNIHLKKTNGDIELVTLNEGDLLIFKTEDFVNDESIDVDRIVLVGSIANVVKNKQTIKKAML